MSSPNRTAFFDREEGEIYEPAKGFYVVDPTGDIVTPDREGELRDVDNLIPLTSTGLEDAAGKEIFEGHLMEEPSEGSVWAVMFKQGQFVIGTSNGSIPLNSLNDTDRIIGHALTDAELVPDSFDTEEYFGLEVSKNGRN